MDTTEELEINLTPLHEKLGIKNVIVTVSVTLLISLIIGLQFEATTKTILIGVGVCFFYLALAFTSNYLNDFDRGQWPSICISDTNLKIIQDNALLWSKPLEAIESVEVEKKKFFGVSQNAVLIKANDKDSYYINVAKKLESKLDIDQVAEKIRQAV